ncbi:DUF5684 domain-containing protein [Carboxylicivirga sp. RSCT41]|uniref:DUF5684 domain-containing protein n=1 Tax=Carboxylicivirga agarovorans TaxID=3417570 RepID=UPI003D331E43
MDVLLSIVYFAVAIAMLAANWKIYEKAGKPGWASLIPIYNILVLLDIVGKSRWLALLLLIPFVNALLLLFLLYYLAKSFGKSGAFALGLIFLAPVFYPMLAFGDSIYYGPVVAEY